MSIDKQLPRLLSLAPAGALRAQQVAVLKRSGTVTWAVAKYGWNVKYGCNVKGVGSESTRTLHSIGLCERLARANAYQDDVLARVVVVESGARARVRDADGDQLVVLSDVRGCQVWVDQGLGQGGSRFGLG